jgi:hypothetical protein
MRMAAVASRRASALPQIVRPSTTPYDGAGCACLARAWRGAHTPCQPSSRTHTHRDGHALLGAPQRPCPVDIADGGTRLHRVCVWDKQSSCGPEYTGCIGVHGPEYTRLHGGVGREPSATVCSPDAMHLRARPHGQGRGGGTGCALPTPTAVMIVMRSSHACLTWGACTRPRLLPALFSTVCGGAKGPSSTQGHSHAWQ